MDRFNVLKKINILLVEDDEIARLSLKKSLGIYANSVKVAKDGLEGLDEFKKDKVDVVITDINMPNLNGLEMMEEIIKIKPNQMFFVITSYDTDENLFKSMQKGATFFLKKPIVIEELLNALIINLLKISSQKIRLSKRIFVDPISETIFMDDKALFLSLNEHKLLWLFVYNLGRVVSYDMINEYVYYGKDMQNSSIHTAVMRLKKNLVDLDIENVASVGYALKTYEG